MKKLLYIFLILCLLCTAAPMAFAAELEGEQPQEKLHEEMAARPDYGKYYVQNGLVVWLDAFVGFADLNETLDVENHKWYSRVGEGVYADLGTADLWQTGMDACRGIGYRLSKEEYLKLIENDAETPAIGVHLDASLLPKGSYTIETVANPVGLTNPDGSRFTDAADSAYTWGIYTDTYSAFSFGPFKATAFLCASEAKNGGALGMRWVYSPKEWREHDGNNVIWSEDLSLSEIADGQTPVTLSVQKAFVNEDKITFSVFMNGTLTYLRDMVDMADADPEFHLFKGLASTVYSVRVYDRVLSDAEKAQNHFADLLSYYGLDTTRYDAFIMNLVDPASFYASFGDVGFDLTREEAEAIFMESLAETMIAYNGLSLRLDQKVGLRATFLLNEANCAALEAAGFRVVAGCLLNTEGAYPTLEDFEYQVVFRQEGAKNAPFYLGEALAAMTVNFQNPDPLMCGKPLYFNGYVKLEDAEGNTLCFYENAASAAFDHTIFSGYDYLSRQAGYGKNAFVKKTVNNCFEMHNIFVDAENGSDLENGEDAAVKTWDRAFALLLELLETEVPVNVTVSLEAGDYPVWQNYELDMAKYPGKYLRLSILGSEDGETVLKGSENFDGAGFRPVSGKPYYTYRFEKDADGNYPLFRFFYVNGLAQKVASQGYTRVAEAEAEDGKMYNTGEQIMVGVDANAIGVVEELIDGKYKLYLDPSAVANLQEGDLHKLEFHMAMAWYYRIMHVESVDYTDTDKNGNVAVCFRAEEMELWEAQHNFRGHYYFMANALSYLDEPGEYYYDETAGVLYYYPAEGVDLTQAECAIPKTEHMLSFLNANDVTLENLVFTGNDNLCAEGQAYLGSQAATAHGPYGNSSVSALFLKNNRNITVYACIFRDLATSAVRGRGTQRDIEVDSCSFLHIGSSGIDFGNRSSKWKEDVNAYEDILITNNYLEDIATYTRGSVAIIVNVSKNLEISYNTVKDCSYSAISIGWGWGLVDYIPPENFSTYGAQIYGNYLANFMTDLSDGGAIYTINGNANIGYKELFNEICYNFAHMDEKSWDGKGIVMPYYHDGSSTNWHTYENVLLINPGKEVLAAIYLQNISSQLTYNILVENNYITASYFKTWPAYRDRGEWTEADAEYVIFGPDTSTSIINGRHSSRVDARRNLAQENNVIFDMPEDAYSNAYVMEILDMVGCDGGQPDGAAIFARAQALYEAYYAKLEAEYAASNQ